MKIKWNEESTTKTISGIIMIAAGIIIYLLLSNLASVFEVFGFVLKLLNPFIVGFAIAYVLNVSVRFFEEKVFTVTEKKKPHPKAKRILSILTSYLILFAAFIALVSVILPQLIDSVKMLINNMTDYRNYFLDFLSKLNLPQDVFARLNNYFTDFFQDFTKIFNETILPNILQFFIDITSSIVNLFISIIVSIYFLYRKELFIAQTKKIMYAFFSERRVERFITVAHRTDRTFNSYIFGKIIDSVIVGILNFIAMSVFGLEYSILISVLVAITNVIPIFGPFIGGIPSALLLLLINPWHALIFIIISLILQQVDGNIICPIILGDSTGLSAFWVMFAIVVGGGMFGFVGMFIGIPIFAVIYSIVKSLIEERLTKRSLSVHTKDYSSQDNSIKF